MRKYFILLFLVIISVILIGCKKINTTVYSQLTSVEYTDLVSTEEEINKIQDDFYNNFMRFEIETVGKYSYLTMYLNENGNPISLKFSLINNNIKHLNLNFSWEGTNKEETTAAYVYYNNTNIIVCLDYFVDNESLPYQLIFKAKK